VPSVEQTANPSEISPNGTGGALREIHRRETRIAAAPLEEDTRETMENGNPSTLQPNGGADPRRVGSKTERRRAVEENEGANPSALQRMENGPGLRRE
jgi:hypothetical protein